MCISTTEEAVNTYIKKFLKTTNLTTFSLTKATPDDVADMYTYKRSRVIERELEFLRTRTKRRIKDFQLAKAEIEAYTETLANRRGAPGERSYRTLCKHLEFDDAEITICISEYDGGDVFYVTYEYRHLKDYVDSLDFIKGPVEVKATKKLKKMHKELQEQSDRIGELEEKRDEILKLKDELAEFRAGIKSGVVDSLIYQAS